MKNSFLWFLGLVSVLIVGTFLAIPSNQSVPIDEVTNELKGEETASQTSEPNIIDSSEVNTELKETGEALTVNVGKQVQTKLQVTMAQVGPDGNSVFGGVGPPGETVLLFNGNTVIAEAIINEKGDWVAVPETRFESGSHFIQLAIKPNGDGQETDRLSLTVVKNPVNNTPSKPDKTAPISGKIGINQAISEA